MPLRLAHLANRLPPRAKASSADQSPPTSSPDTSPSIYAETPQQSYFPISSQEDSDGGAAETRELPPGARPLPSMQRHASSPLAQSMTAAEVSPKTGRVFTNLMRRSRSKTGSVEPMANTPTTPPRPIAGPSTSSPPSSRPKLTMRTRSASLNRFVRSRSDSSITASLPIPESASTDSGNDTFTLKSFRSTTGEMQHWRANAEPASPPSTSPSLSMPRARTPPLGPPVRRPSSQIFNDPLASPPSSPSIKASYFQEARAARSNGSLGRHDTTSPKASPIAEQWSRPPSRLDLANLPVPPPMARAREPLAFSPPLTEPNLNRSRGSLAGSASTGSRPTSPGPFLGRLESPAAVQVSGLFSAPKPAFFAAYDRRDSMSEETMILRTSAENSPFRSPTLGNVLPRLVKAASESHYGAVATSIRDKAKKMAVDAYAYANERTEQRAARESLSTEGRSIDATVETDSEDGTSDGTSETSHSRAEDRHAWGSDAAQKRRAEAAQQVLKASQQFATSYTPALAKAVPVPACMPALAPPLFIDTFSNEPIETLSRPMLDEQSRSGRMIDRPRPISRSRSEQADAISNATRPVLQPTPPVTQSAEGQLRQITAAPPGREQRYSWASMDPMSQPRSKSLRSAHLNRPVSLFVAPTQAPAGVEPSVWESLPVEQQLAIEEQGRAYMARLAEQAAQENSRFSVVQSRNRLDTVAQKPDGRPPRHRSSTTG